MPGRALGGFSPSEIALLLGAAPLAARTGVSWYVWCDSSQLDAPSYNGKWDEIWSFGESFASFREAALSATGVADGRRYPHLGVLEEQGSVMVVIDSLTSPTDLRRLIPNTARGQVAYIGLSQIVNESVSEIIAAWTWSQIMPKWGLNLAAVSGLISTAITNEASDRDDLVYDRANTVWRLR